MKKKRTGLLSEEEAAKTIEEIKSRGAAVAVGATLRQRTPTSDEVHEPHFDWGKTADEFLNAYAPSRQAEFYARTADAYFGQHPTLGAVKRHYGYNTLLQFLCEQIGDYSDGLGKPVRMETTVVRQAAVVIATKYLWLKVSEVLLFFFLLKSGTYASMGFQRTDVPTLCGQFALFVGRERAQAIFEREINKNY